MRIGKWLAVLLIIIVAIAVAAGIVFLLNVSNDEVYKGSDGYDTYALTISNGSFTLDETKISSFDTTVYETYKGDYTGDRLIVHEHDIRTVRDGTEISHEHKTNLNENLADSHRVRIFSDGFVIDGIYLARDKTVVSYRLIDVTTGYNFENGGDVVKIGRGESKASLVASINDIVECYTDCTQVRYSLSEADIGYIDLNTVGPRTVDINYTYGRIVTINVEVIEFNCTVKIMPADITFDSAVKEGYITITPSTAVVTPIDWDSSEGTRDIGLKYENFVKYYEMTFRSKADTEVDHYTTTLPKSVLKGTDLPEFTVTFYLKSGKVYEDIPSDKMDVSGYDKNVFGAQTLKIGYLGSVIENGIFVYEDSKDRVITEDAKLICVDVNPPVDTDIIYYDENGINYALYHIQLIKCGGYTVDKPLKSEIIDTHGQSIDYKTRKAVYATIKNTYIDTIDGKSYYYEYSQNVMLIPQGIDDIIRTNLSIEHITDSSKMTQVNAVYADRIWYSTLSKDPDGEVIQTVDTGTASWYHTTYLTYDITDKEVFKLYLGSERFEFDMTGTILDGSKTSGYIPVGDDYLASFWNTVTEENISKYASFGVSVGDKIYFDVTYNRIIDLIDSMDISVEHGEDTTHICTIECTYDATDVHYSERVQKYIDHDTIDFRVTYAGSIDKVYKIVSPTKNISFVCDEGYGIYKDSAGTMQYTVPVGGIDGTTRVYYCES